MYFRKEIEFKADDSTTLRGWFFTPKELAKKAPGIIMTHGFSALKEHALAKFAEVFVEAGMCVLVYDNRNLGDSDGEPRFEIDPASQIKDMQSAISFIQRMPEVDPAKIGLWGSSLSGGNVLVVAAKDKRVKCVVIQVPFVKGHHPYLKATYPELWETIQKKYAADQKKRTEGKSPAMTPVVTQDPEKMAVMKQPSAYEFFTSIPQWQNQVTLKSLENVGDYFPMDVIQEISSPLLFIIADHDTVCVTKLQLEAYAKALAPKKLVTIEGEHFAPYIEQFAICSQEACRWFKRVLE